MTDATTPKPPSTPSAPSNAVPVHQPTAADVAKTNTTGQAPINPDTGKAQTYNLNTGKYEDTPYSNIQKVVSPSGSFGTVTSTSVPKITANWYIPPAQQSNNQVVVNNPVAAASQQQSPYTAMNLQYGFQSGSLTGANVSVQMPKPVIGNQAPKDIGGIKALPGQGPTNTPSVIFSYTGDMQRSAQSLSKVTPEQLNQLSDILKSQKDIDQFTSNAKLIIPPLAQATVTEAQREKQALPLQVASGIALMGGADILTGLGAKTIVSGAAVTYGGTELVKGIKEINSGNIISSREGTGKILGAAVLLTGTAIGEIFEPTLLKPFQSEAEALTKLTTPEIKVSPPKTTLDFVKIVGEDRPEIGTKISGETKFPAESNLLEGEQAKFQFDTNTKIQVGGTQFQDIEFKFPSGQTIKKTIATPKAITGEASQTIKTLTSKDYNNGLSMGQVGSKELLTYSEAKPVIGDYNPTIPIQTKGTPTILQQARIEQGFFDKSATGVGNIFDISQTTPRQFASEELTSVPKSSSILSGLFAGEREAQINAVQEAIIKQSNPTILRDIVGSRSKVLESLGNKGTELRSAFFDVTGPRQQILNNFEPVATRESISGGTFEQTSETQAITRLQTVSSTTDLMTGNKNIDITKTVQRAQVSGDLSEDVIVQKPALSLREGVDVINQVRLKAPSTNDITVGVETIRSPYYDLLGGKVSKSTAKFTDVGGISDVLQFKNKETKLSETEIGQYETNLNTIKSGRQNNIKLLTGEVGSSPLTTDVPNAIQSTFRKSSKRFAKLGPDIKLLNEDLGFNLQSIMKDEIERISPSQKETPFYIREPTQADFINNDLARLKTKLSIAQDLGAKSPELNLIKSQINDIESKKQLGFDINNVISNEIQNINPKKAKSFSFSDLSEYNFEKKQKLPELQTQYKETLIEEGLRDLFNKEPVRVYSESELNLFKRAVKESSKINKIIEEQTGLFANENIIPNKNLKVDNVDLISNDISKTKLKLNIAKQLNANSDEITNIQSQLKDLENKKNTKNNYINNNDNSESIVLNEISPNKSLNKEYLPKLASAPVLSDIEFTKSEFKQPKSNSASMQGNKLPSFNAGLQNQKQSVFNLDINQSLQKIPSTQFKYQLTNSDLTKNALNSELQNKSQSALDLRSVLKAQTKSESLLKNSQDTALKTESLIKSLLDTQLKQDTQTIQVTQQSQVQEIKPILSMNPFTINVPNVPTPKPPKPKSTEDTLPININIKVPFGSKQESAFDVFVRGKGRKVNGHFKAGDFFKANKNPQTMIDAQSLGEEKVLSSAKQTFFIRPTAQPVGVKEATIGFDPSKLYINKKGYFVQTRKTAISSAGEKAEIKRKGKFGLNFK